MDREKDNINLDEFVEIHYRLLEKNASKLSYKKEKLKRIVNSEKRVKKPIKIAKLISAYSFMIIIFTLFSFMIINHFYDKDTIKIETINMTLFHKDIPGSILESFNDEIKR